LQHRCLRGFGEKFALRAVPAPLPIRCFHHALVACASGPTSNDLNNTMLKLSNLQKKSFLWLTLALLIAAIGYYAARRNVKLEKVTIAVPLQVAGGAFFVGQHQRLFDGNSIDLQLREFKLGKDALAAVLAGQADLAVVADVPAMLAMARGQDIAIVSVVFNSREAAALLVRADHGIRSVADLQGRTVATVSGTNVEYMLDRMLGRHQVERAGLKLRTLSPAAMTEAFRLGEVDAITSWQPDLAQLKFELGPTAVALYEPDIFVYRFLLVGKRSFLSSHPAQVRGVLTALEASGESMRRAPQQAIGIIGRKIALDATELGRFFDANDYRLVLDQSLLVALDDQTRWAMGRSMIPPGAIPNYLDFIVREPLQAVLPGADRMIVSAPSR
jgi:NitT/TauT family transport system substrate-binding protein